MEEIDLDMDDLFGEEPPDIQEEIEERDGEEEEEQNDNPPENEEGEKKKEAPKPKRVVKPRPVLNPDRLCGGRGIPIMAEFFKDIKFQGKGHEVEDLDTLLKKLEHWAHRLYPKFSLDDCLEKIEKIGAKKQVQINVKKIRMGLPTIHDDFQKLAQNEVVEENPQEEEEDVFNELLREHAQQKQMQLTDEQKERMERNKALAIERRKSKLNAQLSSQAQDDTEESERQVPDTERLHNSIPDEDELEDLLQSNMREVQGKASNAQQPLQGVPSVEQEETVTNLEQPKEKITESELSHDRIPDTKLQQDGSPATELPQDGSPATELLQDATPDLEPPQDGAPDSEPPQDGKTDLIQPKNILADEHTRNKVTELRNDINTMLEKPGVNSDISKNETNNTKHHNTDNSDDPMSPENNLVICEDEEQVNSSTNTGTLTQIPGLSQLSEFEQLTQGIDWDEIEEEEEATTASKISQSEYSVNDLVSLI